MNERVRLTKLSKRGGSAAQHPPDFLFPQEPASVRLADAVSVVTTAQVLAPHVDDPNDFGRIAAACALSACYAMGAKPLSAFHLLGFPFSAEGLGVHVIRDILHGGAEIAREAGIEIVGGHTHESETPTYGLAVTGMAQPGGFLSPGGGKTGDSLVLTKPIGAGIVSAAAEIDRDDEGAIAEAILVMSTLNAAASRAMVNVAVNAAIDVTSFGLLGHLRLLAKASGRKALVSLAAVPVLDAARRYVAAGIAPEGTYANWRHLRDHVEFAADVSKSEQLLLCDVETSGGLILAVPKHREDDLLVVLRAEGTLAAAVIGELVNGEAGNLEVAR